ncbi:hypothetical protein MMPV_005691 [Pyropia vietnamensis]
MSSAPPPAKAGSGGAPVGNSMMDVSSGGAFVRKPSVFRDWVRADGSTPFTPASGRYILYVSMACPWAHRTLITRALKGLESAIAIVVVHPYMGEDGWHFVDTKGEAGDDSGRCEPEPLFGFHNLSQLYRKASPEYSGRFTVPVLWDKEQNTIVNNESSEIIQMLNSEFNEFATKPDVDLLPAARAKEILDLAESFYNTVNNGVYRCGFATSQSAYDVAFKELFDELDHLNEHLSTRRYMAGSSLTLADVRLFPTLARFDAVYVQHFKTNLRQIKEYEHLYGYVRDVYQVPGVGETVDIGHIKRHYTTSHPTINKYGIIPNGPDLTNYFTAPVDRTGLTG